MVQPRDARLSFDQRKYQRPHVDAQQTHIKRAHRQCVDEGRQKTECRTAAASGSLQMRHNSINNAVVISIPFFVVAAVHIVQINGLPEQRLIESKSQRQFSDAYAFRRPVAVRSQIVGTHESRTPLESLAKRYI